MILLDTNVLSALMQERPDLAVAAWLDRRPAPLIWTTAVTVLELRFGIELLAAGQRRQRLEQAYTRLLGRAFLDRIVPFDQAAAEAAAEIAAERQRGGRPGAWSDTQIAGIAVSRRATLATRNVRHFSDLPVGIVDPWSA